MMIEDGDEATRRDALGALGREAKGLAGGLLKGRSRPEINAHFGDALFAATAIHQGEQILTADAVSQRVFGQYANYLAYRRTHALPSWLL